MKYIYFDAINTDGHEWQHSFFLMEKHGNAYETRAEAEDKMIKWKESVKINNSHISTHHCKVFGLEKKENGWEYDLITLEKL